MLRNGERRGWDWGNVDASLMALKARVHDRTIEFVPARPPSRVVVPATPGKNKLVATMSPALKAQLGKLEFLATIADESRQQVVTLQNHQAKAKGAAKALHAFSKVFPTLSGPTFKADIAGATAALDRVSSLNDEQVFAVRPEVFASLPAIGLPGQAPTRMPAEPPLQKGVAASMKMLRLLSDDRSAGAAAREWVTASVRARRGHLHGSSLVTKVRASLLSVQTAADHSVAAALFDAVDEHIARAPSAPALATADLTGDGSLMDALLEWQGTRLGPWLKLAKQVPKTIGGFAGPPRLSVALVNAAGYVFAKELFKEGPRGPVATKLYGFLESCFNAEAAAGMRAAVNSSSKGALHRFLTNEFRTARGLRVFRREIGAPTPAGMVQRGPGMLGLSALFQLVVVVDLLANRAESEVGGEFVLTVADAVTQTARAITMGREALAIVFPSVKQFQLSASQIRFLQQTNIALAAASSVIGLCIELDAAWGAYLKGDRVQMFLGLGKASANGVLLACMLAPNPVLQAGAMAALLGANVYEAFRGGGEAEILAKPVNGRLHELGTMLKDPTASPLAHLLTSDELASVDSIVRASLVDEIAYAGSAGAGMPGGVGSEDVKILRDCGFTLPEIMRLLNRAHLDESELR